MIQQPCTILNATYQKLVGVLLLCLFCLKSQVQGFAIPSPFLATTSSMSSNLRRPSITTTITTITTMLQSSFDLEDFADTSPFDEEDFNAMSDMDDDDNDNNGDDDDKEKKKKYTPPTAPQQKLPIRRYKSTRRDPLIAIVGRPNVGKSALVNRLAGTQSGGSIVADQSGITRDRTYRNANFLGEQFQVIDTGGLVFDDDPNTLFTKEIRQQAMVAISEASGVILVVDGQSGVSPMDLQIADFLRKDVLRRGLPVHVAVNKCESVKASADHLPEFWNLGLGEPVPVSALHGRGVAELLEAMFESIVQKKTAPLPNFGLKVKRLQEAKQRKKSKVPFPGEDELDFKLRLAGIGDEAKKIEKEYEDARKQFEEEEGPEEWHIAIVGRPNVGKSSLLNALFGDTRAIVSEIAGTTRDSIDAMMERPAAVEGGSPTIYRFVDTAGIRKRGKIQYGPEFFMINRALRAIRRSDVVLLVLDATEGVTEQDKVLADRIATDGRACAIICNKWDAVVEKDSSTYTKGIKYIRESLSQLNWAPILFLSAETGQRVGKIYDVVDEAVKAHRKRVPTSVLNEVLRDSLLWQAPPTLRNGAQAKIYYCHQVSTRPPTIAVFCNDPSLVKDNYRRYLERKFRESLNGFEATPIRWLYRGRRQRQVTRKMSGNIRGEDLDTRYPHPHAY